MFIASAVIIFGLVIAGAAFPVAFGNAAEAALTSITELFGWFYLFSVFGFVVFLIGLALSKYGKVRLGPQDSTPSYSFFSWISMLLAAGFGVGLVFYGMAEPMTHYINPPYGDVPAESEAAARAYRWWLGTRVRRNAAATRRRLAGWRAVGASRMCSRGRRCC